MGSVVQEFALLLVAVVVVGGKVKRKRMLSISLAKRLLLLLWGDDKELLQIAHSSSSTRVHILESLSLQDVVLELAELFVFVSEALQFLQDGCLRVLEMLNVLHSWKPHRTY